MFYFKMSQKAENYLQGKIQGTAKTLWGSSENKLLPMEIPNLSVEFSLPLSLPMQGTLLQKANDGAESVRVGRETWEESVGGVFHFPPSR